MKTVPRWQQRFLNFQRALSQLEKAVELAKVRKLSDLEQQGLIQAFEFTHELSWNTLKDFLIAKGAGPLYGSRDTTRAAFQAGLIEAGEVWMRMIESRNRSSHSYDEKIANDVIQDIQTQYFQEFAMLSEGLAALKETP